MNILNKISSKIHSKGGVNNGQLCITLQKSTVIASKFKKNDEITVTVLENGSILIERADKKHD